MSHSTTPRIAPPHHVTTSQAAPNTAHCHQHCLSSPTPWCTPQTPPALTVPQRIVIEHVTPDSPSNVQKSRRVSLVLVPTSMSPPHKVTPYPLVGYLHEARTMFKNMRSTWQFVGRSCLMIFIENSTRMHMRPFTPKTILSITFSCRLSSPCTVRPFLVRVVFRPQDYDVGFCSTFHYENRKIHDTLPWLVQLMHAS